MTLKRETLLWLQQRPVLGGHLTGPGGPLVDRPITSLCGLCPATQCVDGGVDSSPTTF